MPNWNHTVLKCNNTEAVQACVMAIKNKTKPFVREDLDYEEGDTKFHAVTAKGVPSEKIKEVSKQFPDDVITCNYYFESDRFSEVHTVEYRNGEDIEVNLAPSYMFNSFSFKNDNDKNAIYKKVEAFCRRLDKTETDKDGKFLLNWFNEPVCYKFEYDGKDGKKYRIEATKARSEIDIKVFEGRAKYDWREISNNDNKDIL